MFSKIVYKPGSTGTNVMADAVKLWTGETSLSNLSTDVVIADSYIIASVAAGWTLHDNAASATSKVIKAICNDGVNYKYVRFDFGALSANNLTSVGYESWNAVSHTGTNAFCQVSESVQLTNGFALFVASNAQYLIWFTYHANAFRSQSEYTALYFDFIPQDYYWNTSYPPWIGSTNYYLSYPQINPCYIPRIKTVSGDAVVTQPVPLTIWGHTLYLYAGTFGNYGSGWSHPPDTTGIGADGSTAVHFLVKPYFYQYGTNPPQAHGKADGPWFETTKTGNAGDYLIYNGVTYFIVVTIVGARIPIPMT